MTGRHLSQPALTDKPRRFAGFAIGRARRRGADPGTNHTVKIKWSPAGGGTANVLRDGVVVQTGPDDGKVMTKGHSANRRTPFVLFGQIWQVTYEFRVNMFSNWKNFP